MKLGKGTKLELEIGTLISLVFTAFLAAGLYYNMATEEYVDMKIQQAMQNRVAKVEVVAEANDDRLDKMDTAISLLSKSVENHDKNMEAFTQALKALSDDIRELFRSRR